MIMKNSSNSSTSSRRVKSLGKHAIATHQDTSQERWLLTYADMITLLLVLFIVLFALSTIDQAKYREFKQSVSKAVLSRTPHGSTNAVSTSKTVDIKNSTNQLKQIEQKLIAALTAKGMIKNVTLTINSSGLVEGFVSDSTFFGLGSATLSPVGTQIVDTSAQVFKAYSNAIEVAGFTDNEPVTGGPYANNWALSAARSTTVVIRMTTRDGLNPSRVVILGYGQFHPIVPNTSPANQALNRRVDITVSPTSQFKQ